MLYKHVEIENLSEITKELQDYVFTKHADNKRLFIFADIANLLSTCPKISNWFKSMELVPKNCLIISYHPEVSGPSTVHSDTTADSLAINFGIHNNEDTYTVLYELLDGTPMISSLANDIKYISYQDVKLKEVTRYNLTKPIIFNTKTPHAVHNPTDDVRISISFRFENNPWHLLND